MPINATASRAVVILSLLSGAAAQAAEAPRPADAGQRPGMYSTDDLALKLVAEVGPRKPTRPALAALQDHGAGIGGNVALQLYRRLEQRRYFNR